MIAHIPRPISWARPKGWPSFFINIAKPMTGPIPNKMYPGAMSFSALYPNALNDQYFRSGFVGGEARIKTDIKAVTHPDTSSHIPKQITPASFRAFKFMVFFLTRSIEHHLLRMWPGAV
jgi:hypothetical protein